jgi:hypothetical protein
LSINSKVAFFHFLHKNLDNPISLCYSDVRSELGAGFWRIAAMTQETVLEQATTLEAQCAHHWIIEAAGGPTSKGSCRRCGAVKEFLNYIEGGSWDYDRTSARDTARGRAPSLRVSDDTEAGDDS